MWFNKANGRVYIGSGSNGARRLGSYYQPSVLNPKRTKSLIYQNILKYGHGSFSLIILEVCGNTSDVSKSHLISREQFYLDLKTYGLKILNLLNLAGSSSGFKHTE